MFKKFGTNGFTDALHRPGLGSRAKRRSGELDALVAHETLRIPLWGSRHFHRLANRGGRAGARRAS